VNNKESRKETSKQAWIEKKKSKPSGRVSSVVVFRFTFNLSLGSGALQQEKGGDRLENHS